MKKLIAVIAGSTLAMGLMIGSALAQDEGSTQAPDKTVFKKKTVIDFSDATIQGELTRPEGSYVNGRKKSNFRSLLKLRANFLPELFNSTDNL